LATACMEVKAGVERDFLPLTVDYREYTSAAGKIPGGFFKREGRPTEKEIIINPTNSQRDVSDLDLVVVGTEDAVVMVEAGANQLSEEMLLECIFRAHAEIQKIVKAQHQLFREGDREKPSWTAPELYPESLYQQVRADLYAQLKAALFTKKKFERKASVNAVVKPYLERIPAEQPERKTQVKKIISRLEEEILREVVINERTRFDSRRLDEIRNIEIEAGVLPRTHGSALFTRGETQALASATLGTSRDAQVIEEYEGESIQKFMLHYNFPPFSVGEVKFLRGPGRREIGHGALAERSLAPMMPAEEGFPYTVRVVSEITESNGSSSMASVCGGSLAMMDAGVPLKAPVAGVAMGLVMN